MHHGASKLAVKKLKMYLKKLNFFCTVKKRTSSEISLLNCRGGDLALSFLLLFLCTVYVVVTDVVMACSKMPISLS